MTFDLIPHLAARVAPARFPRAGFAIVDETPADVLAREALFDAAFGLALVAKDETGELIATLRLWPIHAGGRRPALLLGPLAVAEHARSLGRGVQMIRASLARTEALGHRAVLLVSDAPYYARFDFERHFTERLTLPGPVEPARFLVLELAPGALAGAQGRVTAAPHAAPLALSRAA